MGRKLDTLEKSTLKTKFGTVSHNKESFQTLQKILGCRDSQSIQKFKILKKKKFKGHQITSRVVQLFNFSFVPLWINSQLKIDSWRMSCRIWQPRRSRLPTGKLRLQRSFSGMCVPPAVVPSPACARWALLTDGFSEALAQASLLFAQIANV